WNEDLSPSVRETSYSRRKRGTSSDVDAPRRRDASHPLLSTPGGLLREGVLGTGEGALPHLLRVRPARRVQRAPDVPELLREPWRPRRHPGHVGPHEDLA